MSLDRAIRSGKEKRRPYRGAKAVDRTCRNHGSCPYCLSNRLHSFRKRDIATQEQLTLTKYLQKSNSIDSAT